MKTKLITNVRLGKIAAVFIALSVFISACNPDEEIILGPVPVIDYDITSNRTLVDSFPGVDYYVDGCITVDDALLTVNPGVTVQFKSGSCITFANGGALKAVGNDTMLITFEGQQSTKGYWLGMYYQNSNSANNDLEYFNLKDAGGSTNNFRNAALNLGTVPTAGETASRIKMNHVTISNSKGYGMYVSKTAIIDEMAECVITGCDEAPVMLTARNCGVLNNNNTFTGNGDNHIEINGEGVAQNTAEADFTIARLSVPYLLKGEFAIYSHIIVEPGTRFVMGSNAWIYVGAPGGNLDMLGTSTSRITVRGLENTKGYWRGMTVEYDGMLDIDYTDISDAGNANNGLAVPLATISAVGFGNTSLSVTNSSISNSLNNGIAIQTAQTTYNPDIATSNTFTDIDGDNVHLY